MMHIKRKIKEIEGQLLDIKESDIFTQDDIGYISSLLMAAQKEIEKLEKLYSEKKGAKK